MLTKESYASLVHAIADLLDGFTVEEIEQSYARLRHQDGRKVFLHADFWKKRLHINGSYGLDVDGRCLTPYTCGVVNCETDQKDQISVSGEKSPAMIARDIERRFLPRYTELYLGCRAYVENQRRKRNRADDGLKEIAESLGIPPEISGEHDKRLRLQGKLWGSFRTMDGGMTYALEVWNLPLEKARLIAEMLKDG
jgi:hypothetical protein